MEIVNRISRMAAITAKTLVTDVKIGLVPTPGALHPGQLGLLQPARSMADLVVVSIFTNRMEFADEEEFRQYPRDITADVDLLKNENIDYVFIPPGEEMYPPNFSSFAEVRNSSGETAGLPDALLRGMATATLKIMHLVKPAYIFYGEPDALQATIVRKMIRDFNISAEVIILPVPREPSGLACSGRNRMLPESQLARAAVISRSLRTAQDAITSGETNSKRILALISGVMAEEPAAAIEYAAIVDPESLEPVSRIDGPAVIGIGGRIGNVFLTDAVTVGRR